VSRRVTPAHVDARNPRPKRSRAGDRRKERPERIPPFTRTQTNALRRALLRWYRRHARDLPWRRTRDPYPIWLSEVLLQQTRIETALPYYQRFLGRFPTVQQLARARLDDVLTLWAGLGYYTRARNLHRAAGIIVADRNGAFPESAGQWRSLPGIGPYAAAAIASITRGEPIAAVDGNVKRVIARVFAVRASIDDSATLRRITALAQSLLAPRSPGDFNQAMMELGARVCAPKRPACESCPLHTWCRAAQADIQHTLPTRRKKPEIPQITAVAAAISRNGRYLLAKRPPRGLLAGLWQLPTCELNDGDSHAGALRAHLQGLLGAPATIGAHIGTIVHTFSHRRLELHVYRCEMPAARIRRQQKGGLRWVAPRQFDSYALASVDRKACALL
jgi:A/G-specific adenine glycosylase